MKLTCRNLAELQCCSNLHNFHSTSHSSLSLSLKNWFLAVCNFLYGSLRSLVTSFPTFFSVEERQRGLGGRGARNLSSTRKKKKLLPRRMEIAFVFSASRNNPKPFFLVDALFTVNFSYFHIRIDSIKVKWKSDKRIKENWKNFTNFSSLSLVLPRRLLLCCWCALAKNLKCNFTHLRRSRARARSTTPTSPRCSFSYQISFLFILRWMFSFQISFISSLILQCERCDKEIHHLQMFHQLFFRREREAAISINCIVINRVRAEREDRREKYERWKLNSPQSISKKKSEQKSFSIFPP